MSPEHDPAVLFQCLPSDLQCRHQSCPWNGNYFGKSLLVSPAESVIIAQGRQGAVIELLLIDSEK